MTIKYGKEKNNKQENNMKDYNNTKARKFFGDEIVNKLEEQHQG